MSKNHSLTKRNRRPISHTRGHEGRETQLALRSPEAKSLAAAQIQELLQSALDLATEAYKRRIARDTKRTSMRKS